MSRMKLEYTIDDIREVEQDAYERGRRDALEELDEFALAKMREILDDCCKRAAEENTSEDCISRAETIVALDWLPKHKQIGEGEWSIKESDIKGMLRGMASVVPQAERRRKTNNAAHFSRKRGKNMKSTIEIKTAFEGCAENCKWYMPECIEVHKADCENRFLCEEIAKRIRAEQTADNPLDDLFADSLDKLDKLGVEE